MSSLPTTSDVESNDLSSSAVLTKIEDSYFTNFAGNVIEETQSLMIVDPAVLNAVQVEFDFGRLLGKVGEYQQYTMKVKVDGKNNPFTPGDFVKRTFLTLVERQTKEAEYYKNAGGPEKPRVVPKNRSMAHVFETWESLRQSQIPPQSALEDITVPNINDLRGGPFRLLAVVNRMDLAGDHDPRTQNEITRDPRSLGELHLLYSFVDKTFERDNPGKAYPMVFALKYRLPILEKNSIGTIIDTSGIGFRDLVDPANNELWRDKMQIWAQLWAGLSNIKITDNKSRRDFRLRLENILTLATRPEDFFALESNTQIYDNEFELNSWYVFDGNRQLEPRSMRREPIRCMGPSAELALIVNYYWKDLDLDMESRNFRAGVDDQYKAGYDVLQNNERDLLDNDEVVGINPDQPGNNLYWKSGTCGTFNNEMPYDMKRSGSNGVGRIFMLSGNARIQLPGPRWRLDPLSESNRDLREKKRHAFAIRTCSGCHSQEGATSGFHVSPRLANESSKLSGFLTGYRDKFGALRASPYRPNAVPNAFSFGDNAPTYFYDELYYRKKWLHEALRKDPNMKLYQSLKRPELVNE